MLLALGSLVPTFWPMVQRIRALIAALLGPLVFMLTLGRVQLDTTGEAGAAGGVGGGPETVDVSPQPPGTTEEPPC